MSESGTGDFSPRREIAEIQNAVSAFMQLQGSYSNGWSLGEILSDVQSKRASAELVPELLDDLVALSVLLVRYSGHSTLAEIFEDIEYNMPVIDSGEGNHGQEYTDPRYLRKAGEAWVDERDGEVIVLGMKYIADPELKRNSGNPNIHWQLFDVSEDGRFVRLIPVIYRNGIYIENLAGSIDDIPYGVFRDLYIKITVK